MLSRTTAAAGAVVVCVLFFGMIQGWPSPDGTLDARVRFLSAGIASFRGYSGPLQVTLSVQHHIPGETTVWRYPDRTELQDEDRNVTVRWYRSQDRLAMIVTQASSTGVQPVEERLAETELETRTLQEYRTGAKDPKASVHWRGVVAPAGALQRDGLWVGHDWADPRFYAFYDNMKPLDWVLTKGPVVAIGEEQCNGSRCIRVQVGSGAKGYRTLYWLDRDHSLVIRRVRVYDRLGTREVLIYEADVSAVAGANDVWFPAVFEAKSYMRLLEEKVKNGLDGGRIPLARILTNRTIRKDGIITLPPSTTRVTMTDVVAAPIPDELFVINWPVGTHVDDVIRQESYRVVAVPIKPGSAPGRPSGGNPQ